MRLRGMRTLVPEGTLMCRTHTTQHELSAIAPNFQWVQLFASLGLGYCSLGDYGTEGAALCVCCFVMCIRVATVQQAEFPIKVPRGPSPAHSSGLWISPDHRPHGRPR